MPISPANMALYPGGSIRSPEWLAIREQVRERAGDKCEECGVANGAIGIRHQGVFHALSPDDKSKPGDVVGFRAFDYVPMKVFKIVCTVAHFDGQLVDHSLENLRFWCQRCHNRHDGPSRRANAKATLKAKSGQAELL